MNRTPGWSQVEIAGKTADVFDPPTDDDVAGVVLFLHGLSLRTIADNDAYTAELQRHRLAAVCPHGGRAWWLDVVTGEFDPAISPLDFLHDRVVAYISERWSVMPPLVALAGISMGGQGALQLAYRHAREFPVVAAIAPAVDFHNLYGQGLVLDEMFANREAARQQTATLQLHPLGWPRHQLIVCDPADRQWFEGAERLAMKLSSLGIPFEADLTSSHGGHDWSYFEAMAKPVLDFIADRLDQENRRV